MVLEQMPQVGVIKRCRGLIDFYVLHVGGADIVCARSWPRKSNRYRSEQFRFTANAAHLTNQSYNLILPELRGACAKFHVNLDDYFLDHFRSGYQSPAHTMQSPPPFFTNLQIDKISSFPDTKIRFFRPFPCSLTINYTREEKESYIWHTTAIERGFLCDRRYYLRPWSTTFDMITPLGSGWTDWVSISPGHELEIFAIYPTPAKPRRPWFGPYPIRKILENFDAFFV